MTKRIVYFFGCLCLLPFLWLVALLIFGIFTMLPALALIYPDAFERGKNEQS